MTTPSKNGGAFGSTAAMSAGVAGGAVTRRTNVGEDAVPGRVRLEDVLAAVVRARRPPSASSRDWSFSLTRAIRAKASRLCRMASSRAAPVALRGSRRTNLLSSASPPFLWQVRQTWAPTFGPDLVLEELVHGGGAAGPGVRLLLLAAGPGGERQPGGQDEERAGTRGHGKTRGRYRGGSRAGTGAVGGVGLRREA